ncbi:hypothetical protein [Spirosoma pomorum]
MKYTLSFLSVISCLVVTSCQRPVAYFQPTFRVAASRLPVVASKPIEDSVTAAATLPNESETPTENVLTVISEPVTASRAGIPQQATSRRLEQRAQRIQTLLTKSSRQETAQQPRPKPQKKMRLGNRIRQSLGMPLRQELNWWQRISWKLKAAVIIILIAVLFAILKITLLAIIFGLVSAFLLISGLRRSFKVRRPWF